ncbi:hypothetical protein Hanom_Chr03g00187191 [Helianthus anomalus]
MTVKELPEGEVPWLEKTNDLFLHPKKESLEVQLAVGALVKPYTIVNHAGEEIRNVSSKESVASSGEHLTPTHLMTNVSDASGSTTGPTKGSGHA